MFGDKINDLGPVTFSYVSQFYILSFLVTFSFIFMSFFFLFFNITLHNGDRLQMDKQACAALQIR